MRKGAACQRHWVAYGFLFSDFQPAGALLRQRLTAQPQEMFGATRLAPGWETQPAKSKLP